MVGLDSNIAVFLGTNPDHVLDVGDKDFAVTHLAGMRGLDDRFHHLRQLFVMNQNLQLYLGQKVDHVLGATMHLGMALLAAKTPDLVGGQSMNSGLSKLSLTASRTKGLMMASIFFISRSFILCELELVAPRRCHCLNGNHSSLEDLRRAVDIQAETIEIRRFQPLRS